MMSARRVVRVGLLLLLFAQAVRAQGTAQDIRTAPVLRSRNGMVVSGSALASAAGARILEEGGNAVDAAVATAFALAVVEPSMSGLGGRTQLLIRAQSGDYYGLDGGTAIPTSYPPGTVPADDDAYGYKTIGVPGTVAALCVASQRYGLLPLPRVMAPAIQLARAGFVLPAEEAARIARDSARLAEFEGSRRYFLKPDGSTYKAGERFIQADLARTLEAIAQGGPRVFYTGRIAEQMVNDLRARGGFVGLLDLQRYDADEALIVKGSYRGFDLVGTSLPASGITTIETLHILENFDLPKLAGSPEWAALLARALRVAFNDRVAEFGTPEQKATRLASKAHAKIRADSIRVPTPQPRDSRHSPSPSPSVFAERGANTTHLSVADARGSVVSLTQSLGPNMGSRVAAPGLGFLYAATMGYLGDVKPGDRPFSSQSPMIVTRNNEFRFAIGGAGARRIIPGIVAVLSRAIDQKLTLAQAMSAPRLHVVDNRIDLENRTPARWPQNTVADLRAFGFTVQMRDDAPYFARIHAIQYDPTTREFVGVADPRWNGAAAAPRGQ